MEKQLTVPDRGNKVPTAQHKSIQQYFGGRTLVVATRHHKERVLKLLLESALGVRVVVAKNLDTDGFGTFSGEIEREAGPLETARRKCLAAHEITGESLVIASEGSFGAHPVIGFVPADEEILLLKDFKNGFEIKAKAISTQTNFANGEYTSWEALLLFASQVGFPSHALIMRGTKDDYTEIQKGIASWNKLKSSFLYFINKCGHVYVETDMRALYNPSRMKVIKETGEKLMEVIYSLCPVCEAPGFEVREAIKGLPCGQCNAPTQSAKAYVYYCVHCGHSELKNFPHQKEKEDPMFCDWCNP